MSGEPDKGKKMMTNVEQANAELSRAERHLADMLRNLRNAQEWVRNAEQLHFEKQRELEEAIKAACPHCKGVGKVYCGHTVYECSLDCFGVQTCPDCKGEGRVA